MTDIEALRARAREAAEKAELAGNKLCWGGVETVDREFYALASPANVKALDAEITRLREDLDRVTRERDEARAEYREAIKDRHEADANEKKIFEQWRTAEAALAKRDEEVAAIRGDAHFLLDLLMVHAPAQVTEHPDVVLLRRKIYGPEALTPTEEGGNVG